MGTWPNRRASGGPFGELEERENPNTQAANLTIRPIRSASSQQASSKPGAVHTLTHLPRRGLRHQANPPAGSDCAHGCSHARQARQARQARNVLDAYGDATIAVRLVGGLLNDGARLVWQTPLARRWLAAYFDIAPPDAAAGRVPAQLLAWLQAATSNPEQKPLTLARGPQQLVCTLQGRTSDEDWLVVLRQASDAATVEATMLALRLTPRESEVLCWVGMGKSNRDIGDILGTSPATLKKAPGTRVRKAGRRNPPRRRRKGAATCARVEGRPAFSDENDRR